MLDVILHICEQTPEKNIYLSEEEHLPKKEREREGGGEYGENCILRNFTKYIQLRRSQ
jgi:hypothetical protein